jgi:LacI family transcriptional regulator
LGGVEVEPVSDVRAVVTLADIAREAGTSPSTASRALSGRGYVSTSARARLLDAAERLGYVPNASARTLKQKTSRVVGVVVSDLGNQFYAQLAAGIEETLRAAGYQMLLLSDNSESAHEVEAARAFIAMRAAGVILTPVGHDGASLLARHGIHVVEVDRRLARLRCDAVVVDNERGAREATSHLIALGHHRIGLLVADTDWTSGAGRVDGYRMAHAEARIPVDDELVVAIGFHAPDTADRIGLLIDRGPTAVFAANNALAEETWRLLRRRRLGIPRDVSLVAFDDMPWMQLVRPALTAVEQPVLEVGRTAARLLLRRLDDPDCRRVVECLQPRLRERDSTAPPA